MADSSLCSADFIHPEVGSWDIGAWADDEIECDQCLGPCMYRYSFCDHDIIVADACTDCGRSAS